jgi:hypothetical protein
MALTQLDVVNECIGLLGEAPLTSLDYQHPFVAKALSKLALAEMEIQAKWYWFNARVTELTPDTVTGAVTLPEHACEFFTRYGTMSLAVIGGILTDLESGDPILVPTTGYVIYNYPLEHANMPHLGQLAIRALTLRLFQTDFDSDSQKRGDIAQQLQTALAQLNAMHIRLSRVNLLERPTTALPRFLARGVRPTTR